MKSFSIVALLSGLLIGTLIVAHFGVAAVGAASLAVGWTGFFVINLLHASIIALCGAAWLWLLPPPERGSPWSCIWGRFVRDAGSELLPLSQIGGLVMGARAASLFGLPGRMAAASSVVDATMELSAQLAFAVVALAILAALHPEAWFIRGFAVALAGAICITVLFVALQRRGIAVLERVAERLTRQWTGNVQGPTSVGALQAAIHRIYRRRPALFGSFFLHLLCWVASAVEAWIALRFIGNPLALAPVIAIEGLLYAARAMAFAVPAALGIQEGAYVILGGLFGLSPDVALALSLLKRARALLLGLPALLIWQALEGHRAWRRRRVSATGFTDREDVPVVVPTSSEGA
jgi:glycosyltransferase 2 family protein